MVRLLGIGIEVFSSIIFIVPAVLILQCAVLRQRDFSKMAAVMIFAFYLMAVFLVTGIPTIHAMQVDFSFNLIPLIDIVNSPLDYIRNTLLNVILFVPLGILLPIMWKEYRSLQSIAITGFLLSLFIEILQIFTFRLTDVDDLITNTAGAVAGYYLSRRFLFKRSVDLSKKGKTGRGRQEAFIIFAIVFLIGFFLKPLVSDGIWETVLSSPLWEQLK